MNSWGARPRLVAIVVAVGMLVLSACSGAPSPTVTVTETAVGGVHVDGDTVVVDLTPTEPLDLKIEGVGTLTAPAGVVSSDATVEVRTTSDTPTGAPKGFVSAGQGVSVEVKGGSLAKPVTVTFDSAAAPESGAVPVTLHVSDDGKTTVAPAKQVDGKITVTTKKFSWQLPGWLTGLADFLFDFVLGRTDPPACPPNGRQGPPGWSSLFKGPDSVHACLFNNTDSGGNVRAEIFIQSNRGTYQLLKFPDGAQYTWMDPSSRLATALARRLGAVHGNEIMLAAGGQASAGYLRPPTGGGGASQGYAKLTNYTIAATVMTALTDEFALSAAGQCATDLQGLSFRSPSDLSDMLDCVLSASESIITDPGNAKRRIIDALGGDVGVDIDAHMDKLVAKLKHWKTWGSVLKGAGIALLIPKVESMIADSLGDLNSDHARLTLTLDAQPAPQQPDPVPTQEQPNPIPTRTVAPPPPVDPGPAGAAITVNTCATDGNCDRWNPAVVHSSASVYNIIGEVPRGTQLTARCWTTGRVLTDGNNSTTADDGIQFTSDLWFGVDWNGGRGYVTSVWTTKSNSHLGLPAC